MANRERYLKVHTNNSKIMGLKRNIVDLIIVMLISFAVLTFFVYKNNIWGFVLLTFALIVSILRRVIYNILP
jgi:hypothetical protein